MRPSCEWSPPRPLAMSWKIAATYSSQWRSKSAIEAAAERILVRELEHREPPQVAHHREDVLVHRVHVEEVVLHLADDPPKAVR